jgi:hypothetical protein
MTKSTLKDYTFSGSISRPVLENYLSRSITMTKLLSAVGPLEDNLRMISKIKPKFIGRALCHWGNEMQLATVLYAAKKISKRVHEIDPDIILQAGIFETLTDEVSIIGVPTRVFEAFSLQPEIRMFNYSDMLFPDGSFVNHWRLNSSIPDITRIETQMWFYHLATSYIDAGCEAVHFGQVRLMGRDDKDLEIWFSLLDKIRLYAKNNARRKMVLCDAHVSSGIGCYGLTHFAENEPMGYKRADGRLLLDIHGLPARIKEVDGRPIEAELAVGHLDSIFKRSMGGITPSGWECDSLPYMVDIDLYGFSGLRGESAVGKVAPYQGIDSRHWVWGWDEICWFAHLDQQKRNDWLRYAYNWIRKTDPAGFLEMPGQQFMLDPKGFYHANSKSEACQDGYGQEDTIKEIWDS